MSCLQGQNELFAVSPTPTPPPSKCQPGDPGYPDCEQRDCDPTDPTLAMDEACLPIICSQDMVADNSM